MILGVNPFEDVPGYQLLGLLRREYGADLFAADDSGPAIRILEHLGTQIHHVPHPSSGLKDYLTAVLKLCSRLRIDLVLPATDAHLSALSQGFQEHDRIAQLCPPLSFIAQGQFYNKWALQRWLSEFGNVPSRWPYRERYDIDEWERHGRYPVMVKGMRKGAIKCEERAEVIAAKRTIMENPANQGEFGGAFLEAFVDGEEHSILIITGHSADINCCIGLRKLATTKLGTTLAAEIEDVTNARVDVARIAAALVGPSVVEIEWRVDDEGIPWLFEANLRFPSWIGALGEFGIAVVSQFINTICNRTTSDCARIGPPPSGTIIYRLPESGVLEMARTFPACEDIRCAPPPSRLRNGAFVPELLWAGCAPHQFLMK